MSLRNETLGDLVEEVRRRGLVVLPVRMAADLRGALFSTHDPRNESLCKDIDHFTESIGLTNLIRRRMG